MMNERQQAHVDFYLEHLDYWQTHRPHHSTARLLAARDADEAHPLRSEEEATEVVDHLRRLELERHAKGAPALPREALKRRRGGETPPL